jgi:hypothetical protein
LVSAENNPELLLSRQNTVTQYVVAVVELAAVSLDELVQHANGRLLTVAEAG